MGPGEKENSSGSCAAGHEMGNAMGQGLMIEDEGSVQDPQQEQTLHQTPAEEFGLREQKLSDILENLLNLESGKAKDIVLDCIGNDKQVFINKYEEHMKKKQEEDNIRYLETLEKKLAGIDRKIQDIFVTGNYEDHYRLHEKAVIYIAGQISANFKDKAARKINADVGARQAERVMKELETQIMFYEKKFSREKGREEEYNRQIDALEKGLRDDKFELDVLSKSISKIEEETKRLQEGGASGGQEQKVSGQVQAAGNAEAASEIAAMRKDLGRLYSQQRAAARRINRDSAIYSWKQSFYMNMDLARDESEHVLEQAKSHYDILDSMIKDYRKCGIAIELKEGRILLREMRKMQEGLKQIQEDFSSTLIESAKMRGCPPNGLPVYPASASDGARNVMDKMRQEECLRAYQNFDNLFSRREQ